MAPVTDQKEKKFKYTSLIGKMEKDAAAYGLATSNKKRKEKKEMEKDGDLQMFIRLPNSSKLPLSLGSLIEATFSTRSSPIQPHHHWGYLLH